MKKLRLLLILGVPMVLGTIGFLTAGEGLLQALFQSVQLYLVEYGDLPANVFIEIARWLAPLATASSVLMAVSVLRRKLHNYFLYRKGQCTVVYGPDNMKYGLLKQLDGTGIDGKNEFVKGQRYILLGDEQENLSFYHRYRKELEGAEIYLECTSLPAQAATGENLRLFCPEETAAKLFWKRNCMYELSRSRNHRMEIVFVGFGKLGEELLMAGLQTNIFHPGQQIDYHIFDGDHSFAATHTQLTEISDSVIFHDEPWYQSLALLEKAEAVIVLQQENQLSLLRQLLLAVTKPLMYVFAAHGFGIEILAQQDRLSVLHWEKEARLLENILGDELYDRAKRINLRYAANYSGVEETEENLQKEWNQLDSFTRYSNISSADYHEVQQKILLAEGQSTVYEQIAPIWQEMLAELEHIRWCRYHYLNNWKYGIPANGKRKDAQLRIHADLVAYEQLTEPEKNKDRENVKLMFSVKGH